MMIAKEIKKTVKGNTYMILQDSPTSFHISVSIGNHVIYDFMDTPQSLEQIYTNINTLEMELENKISIDNE